MATLTLRPNAVGDMTQFPVQYPSSTYHWDKVDEVVADNDATYVEGRSGAYLYLRIKENNVSTPSALKALTDSYALLSQQWATKPSNSTAWTWTDIDNLQIGIMEYTEANLEDLYNLPNHTTESETINFIKVYAVAKYYFDGDFFFARFTQVYVEVDYTAAPAYTPENKSANMAAKLVAAGVI